MRSQTTAMCGLSSPQIWWENGFGDVGIEINEAAPCLSEVTIPEETRFEVDVLKHVTYELHL